MKYFINCFERDQVFSQNTSLIMETATEIKNNNTPTINLIWFILFFFEGTKQEHVSLLPS